MKKNLFKLIFTGFFFIFGLTATVEAQNTIKPEIIPGDLQEKLLIPTPNEKIPGDQYIGGRLLPTITRTVIALAGAASVAFIIFGGIQILTAYGNDEQIETAKKTITYAIVGLVIAILSYATVTIISSIQLE